MANVFGFKEPPAFWIAKNISQTGYVTLDTAQTITGYKTFDVDISCNYTIYCQNLVASNNLSATAITATTIYPTQVVFPDNTVQTTAYSATANQVLVTDTLNTTGYLVFAQNAFTGQNSLYMDSTSPRKLTYNPTNGNLYSTSSSIGAESTINPSNSTVRQQSGAPSEIINNATNGSFNFYLSDNFNNQVQVLNMNATGSTFQKQLILGGTGADSQITCVFHSLKDNTLNTNQGLIYCDNGWFLYDNNAHGGRHRFTNNTSGGVQTVPLDFGSTFMTIDITNPPTCTAPQPASNDSSNKIPTTAWVQSAITVAGVNSANTVVMTNNASTNASYPVCFASGSPDGAKSVYQDYTTFAYNPSTNDLSLSSINDIPISLEAGSSIKIGLVGYTDANPLDQNTCIGMYAGGRTARGNTLLGFSAGYNVRLGGDDNVIIGRSAGANVTSGFRNVLIGRDSGNQLATGQRNIAIGFQTGFNSSTASDNILIGSSLFVSATFNNIIIGSTIAGSVADSVYIGTNTQTQYVQTQLNYRTLNYTNTNTNTQNYLYTLPNNLPQIVFLKSLAPFGTFYLYLPDPANGFNYNGTTITFRWAFQTGYYLNHWTVFINGGASKIVVKFQAPAASVLLNNYVGATFLCDDVYWYLQETIAAQ